MRLGTRSKKMQNKKRGFEGFTLIATLLLLLLLSGIAIGMLMMVNTEGKVGVNDVQNNATYHAAEGAIEKMTSDLANAFNNIEAPTVSNIEALSALAPATIAGTGITYPVYTLTPATLPNNANQLNANYGPIASGPNEGLYAQLIPVTLQATAQGPLGDEVSMTRTVEEALIPVFQFGVFSQGDLGFFSSPNLNFAGRVHTNGDLYLGVADGFTLTFGDKLTAYGNVVRANLPNGLAATAFNDNGTVQIPTASAGCSGAQPACLAMSDGANRWGSLTGAGGNPPQSGYNSGPPSWQTVSLTNYNGYLIDGDYGNTANGTGATNLSLPFVNGTTGTNTGPQSFEIIRRPPAGEVPTTPLGASRLYNEASIRIFLSDDPNDLPCGSPSTPPPCGGRNDTQNVRLANYKDSDNGVDYSHGVAQTAMAKLPDGGYPTVYFATASTAVPDPTNWNNNYTTTAIDADWLFGPLKPPPVVTLWDQGTNIAPYMVADPNNNGITKSPTLPALSLCNPSTPTSSPSAPPVCPTTSAYPYYTPLAYPTVPANNSTWNLLDGYLRVEYLNGATGQYIPVTQEWLALGFARGLTPPVTAGSNPINPNAILLFQQPADRNANGVVDAVGAPPGYNSTCTASSHGTCTAWTYTPYPGKPPEVTTDPSSSSPYFGDSTLAAGSQSSTQFNWYPINFYDAREGEPRDAIAGNNSCTPNGIMSAVELDVGNLKAWLAGNTGVSGPSVNYINQNGYVIYFSDRRGMMPNPWGTQVDPTNTKTGDSGLEDDINSATANGTPDGLLDPVPVGQTNSPEDVNLNSHLDNFGAQNIGLGMGYVPAIPANVAAGTPYAAGNQVNSKVMAGAVPDVYVVGNRIPNCSVAQNNWVSGARHVLKLVDGTLGNLPLRPDNGQGGFTVGSENAVYIYGNYNTNAADPIWTGGANQAGEAAAGIIADAVTVLSNNWSDWNSIIDPPTQPNPNRWASTTYYRVAVAGGKNDNFPFPAWETATDYGFGTDGGVHNFLRFLEDWADPGATLNYMGSLVSLYYATYNTGVFKCCAYSVYQPPTRNYIFDPNFTQPQDLPPATPFFRDIDNLSYRQNFTACTVQSNGYCSN
jgi:hypothetical protein